MLRSLVGSEMCIRDRRRFGLQSKESTLIVASYDIALLVVILPATYLTGHVRKPLCIAIGLLVIGLGSLMWTLPHFITEQYVGNSAGGDTHMEEELCGAGTKIVVQAENGETKETMNRLVNYK